jgi:hypothetical protein
MLALAFGGWDAVSSLGGLAVRTAFQDVQLIPGHDLRMEDRAQLLHIQELLASTLMSAEVQTLAVVTLPVALWTIVAAIRLRGGKRGSARWFARAITALAGVGVAQLVFGIRLAATMPPLFEEVLRGADLPSSVDVSELVGNLRSFLQLATIGGAIVGLALAVGKVVGCLYARRCARRPEVMAWTGSD